MKSSRLAGVSFKNWKHDFSDFAWPCQRPIGYHEQSPVNVDRWYVLKTWSSNIFLKLDCSPYSRIEGRCPFQMLVVPHLVTHQMTQQTRRCL